MLTFTGLGKASPTMVPLVGVLIAGFGINDILRRDYQSTASGDHVYLRHFNFCILQDTGFFEPLIKALNS
ncbi:hypothetical protein [Bacillus paralicheniformis]|uniref:hypothetical protein n=1 Tax=Bacillus paralicheniformis TaxID=1648923 RepID=UPI002E203A6B|nr:hypothetical protein [Bacillus paralicheniformis]